MAYAVIELLTLNFAFTPPFRQTLVIRPPLFPFRLSVSVGLVALFHFLFGFMLLAKMKMCYQKRCLLKILSTIKISNKWLRDCCCNIGNILNFPHYKSVIIPNILNKFIAVNS